MEKVEKLLTELANLDADDDGDIILFQEFNWHERIVDALMIIKRGRTLIYELMEGADPQFMKDLLGQVGLSIEDL